VDKRNIRDIDLLSMCLSMWRRRSRWRRRRRWKRSRLRRRRRRRRRRSGWT